MVLQVLVRFVLFLANYCTVLLGLLGCSSLLVVLFVSFCLFGVLLSQALSVCVEEIIRVGERCWYAPIKTADMIPFFSKSQKK